MIEKDREKAALQRLRFAMQSMAGDSWIIDVDGDSVHVIAGRATGEDAHICTIHAAALPVEQDLICGALGNLIMFLGMFDRATDAVRTLRAQIGQREAEALKKNLAAQAAMLLNDRAFQRFLDGKGCGATVSNAATADTRLKSLLAIKSKKDLNVDPAAAASWRRLVTEFEAWKRGGR